MKADNHERRDRSLLIFIVPMALLLMMIVGQVAIRVLPRWSVNVGMRSNLDPDTASARPVSLFQPLLPQILTPMSWAESFLDPGQQISFPPFVVIEPTSTPSPLPVSPTATQPTAIPTDPSPTSTTSPTITASPIPTTPYVPPPTSTTNPPDDPSDPPPTPSPTNTPTPLPTDTPTPTPSATDTPTPTPSPTVPPEGYPTELDDTLIYVPPPSEIDLDEPDGVYRNFAYGSYTVLNVSGNPVIVLETPDDNYDLVLYERVNGNAVFMDHIIIGISQNADGSVYYEVFYWGDNTPDPNTNLDLDALPPDSACGGDPECDNREIPQSELYPYPGAGILIDVDTATSVPPPGQYDYIVIISPRSGDPSDGAQVDAIVVTEVPIDPTP